MKASNINREAQMAYAWHWIFLVTLGVVHMAVGHRWGMKGLLIGCAAAGILAWAPLLIALAMEAVSGEGHTRAAMGLGIFMQLWLCAAWVLFAAVCGGIGVLGRGTGPFRTS